MTGSRLVRHLKSRIGKVAMRDQDVSRGEQGMEEYLFRASAVDFKKIPGSPLAYWVTPQALTAFSDLDLIGAHASILRGISTGDNDRFSRIWHEVSRDRLRLKATSREDARNSGKRWFPYNRGGSFRKWYGLAEDIIDYENNGQRMIQAAEGGETPGFRHDGSKEYFAETVTWSALTSGKPSFRLLPAGFVLGHKG